MRQQTTTFLFQLRHLLFTGRIKHDVVEDLLRPFALYLEQLNALPIIDVLHTIHSTLGNEVRLDLKYLDLNEISKYRSISVDITSLSLIAWAH